MPEHLILVEKSSHWHNQVEACPVITAAEYLTNPAWQQKKNLRIVNLCRSQRYLGEGYYCSLLAEARKHKVIPTVKTLRDLSLRSLYSLETGDIDKRVQRILGRHSKNIETTSFNIDVMFGISPLAELQSLAREMFEIFRVPLMRIVFGKKTVWRIEAIKPLGIQDINEEHLHHFSHALDSYLSKRWRAPRLRRKAQFDLAILHNPKEKMPPSNSRALKNFISSAKKHGIDAELIQPKDIARLAEFDALFIRETTAIDHHTYRFARKAAMEGLVVIDDPDSILRCTNKIFLAELLKSNQVPTPDTVVVNASSLDQLESRLGYPIVIKVPDGSFSRGIYKAENRQQLNQLAQRLFKQSDLLLGQAYTYTPFDWRVGIIGGKPLYVCQYFMTKGHWQIYDHAGQQLSGDHLTLTIEEAPEDVIATAVKAANLIGNGLYGVDLKKTDAGVVVIEVNDNPNIDQGVEDQVAGDMLYDQVIAEFLARLQYRKQPDCQSV